MIRIAVIKGGTAMQGVVAVILAAGKGTRMKSRLPKVLHQVAGKPMVRHVLEAVQSLGINQQILVIGHEAELVKAALGEQVRYAIQAEQLGTGHAVMQAQPLIGEEIKTVLVLCGDTPLLRAETLAILLAEHQQTGAAATVLTANLTDPSGYGRIIRDAQGLVERIVEEKDASAEEKRVQEINTGTYCFDKVALFKALGEISPANAQGEYYLTDVLSVLRGAGQKVGAVVAADPRETYGINSRVQLAEAEKILRYRKLVRLMEAGVTIIDPATTFIDDEVEIEPDTIIYPNTIIERGSRIGCECVIGPGTRIVESRIGNRVEIQNSVLLKSLVGDECTIGPFAYLRPGTELAGKNRVGDFVEIKNSKVGEGSKIPHLAYVGDATVGRNVNIGCGTITCNYDGVRKWPTRIGDGAFIGSNTNLVAPVEIGANAVTGAGSTITKDVPADSLAVERSRQTVIRDWVKKKRTDRSAQHD